ncbi:MAG: zinc-ribbon domain-containing protein [Clostridia bacterium]|nr:zinc-ribbon domain-containing protein [Clostridia bacterium]
MSKSVKCKNCGEEIDAKAVVCPKCGVKVKKAFYKKPWFIAVAIIVIIAAIASSGGEEADKEIPTNNESGNITDVIAEEIVYEEYTVKTLLDDLGENALKAENTYDGKNVKLTGKVSVIDSDGDYISLEPSEDSFTIINVSCYVTDEAQLEDIMEISKGQRITVYGEITGVGELLGYNLDIHKIEY